MRNFRKRTIALCLASVVTVLGSFAENAYQNSLMSLRVDRGSYGTVSLTAFTKKPFLQTLNPEKVDSNTYHIILQGVNSEMTTMPAINGYENIESIQVSTFPYALGVDGYTRITVKTKGEPSVSAVASLYIPDKSSVSTKVLTTTTKTEDPKKEIKKQTSYWEHHDSTSQQELPSVTEEKQKEKPVEQESHNLKNTQSEDFNSNYIDVPPTTSKERMPIFIGIIVLAMLVLLIVFLRKEQMASIVGNQNDFDFDDNDNSKKQKSKTKKIKNAINKLNDKYKNAQPISNINIVTGASLSNEAKQNMEPEEKEPEEPTVIVDLDSLYNEKNKTEKKNDTTQEESSEEYDDLADLLNQFSSEEENPQEEEAGFDEKLYNDTINSENLNFSENDAQRLNQLLQNEIGDETINNIEEFALKEPKEAKHLSDIEILENIIADYTIKQNLSFSKDDVDSIKKLINVELDEDFVTDLRTNPQRTEAMKKELESREKKSHKTSEMLILNVKDMLPDLSKELQKQGNKRIESEAKHDVVYYSEGYEVSKLKVSDDLANMSEAIHSKDASKFRPSDDMPIVENGYEVSTLSIKDSLPDIADYKKNPQKYETKKNVEKIDETALLDSIKNVSFKPFYDDVQEELSHFDGFEVIDNEQEKNSSYEQNYGIIENTDTLETVKGKPVQTVKIKDDAQKLLDLIGEQKAERENKKLSEEKQSQKGKKVSSQDENQNNNYTSVCEIDGKSYSVLKSAICGSFICMLTKNDNGYFVVAQKDENYKILKKYDELKTENIQTRVNERGTDGSVQYLVRIGSHKFIAKITDNNMEFIMDLC